MLAQRNAKVNNMLNAKEQEFRREQQARYRQDLDQQMNARNYLMGQGNMTAIEKQMNRDELNAYKAFDNSTNFAMVPGVSQIKRNAGSLTPGKEVSHLDPETVAKKKLGVESIRKNYERMAKFGLQNMGMGNVGGD
jgi:hypothetical protein